MQIRSSRIAIVIGVVACLAQGAVGELIPASFEEYVGIGMFSSTGSALGVAESVDLTVDSANWANRGGGTGSATAGNVLPVSAETELHLYGDTNISGIGGTTYVLSRFQFMVVPIGMDELDSVPLIFSAFASVSVDSNGPVGQSFGRITTNFVGQLQVDNYDAYGAYTGSWSEQWDLDFNALVGHVYTVDIYARSHGEGAGESYYFDSNVFIDPIINFDPGFVPHTDAYSILYSPGITAPPTVVPEPSSLLLIGVGICMAIRSRTAQRKRLDT